MWQKPIWNSNEILHEKPIFLKFSVENVKNIPWTWIVPSKWFWLHWAYLRFSSTSKFNYSGYLTRVSRKCWRSTLSSLINKHARLFFFRKEFHPTRSYYSFIKFWEKILPTRLLEAYSFNKLWEGFQNFFVNTWNMDFVRSYFGTNETLTSWTLLAHFFSRSVLISADLEKKWAKSV